MNKIYLKTLPPDVVLNLSKLPIAAVFLVNEFFARTGKLPLILELMRDSLESATRSFGTLRNLQLEIEATRKKQRDRLTDAVAELSKE